ncbi:MAG TPA: hypothetical protein VGR80_03155 [Steroidobacteraceae bacterium]|nr:hypothetical protein [Gammaproteobacteria bacterium]HEV2285018.1 hypothetical protein [Steroidobacteraceae bacterium]
MTMIQLVTGTAIGFLLAQAVLYGSRRLLGWLRPGALAPRLRALRAPGPTVLSACIRYAAPVAISVALATLGVWGVSDYLAAKSARSAEANLFDTPAAGSGEEAPRVASAALTPPPPEPAEEPVNAADPYADPEFKVQRKAHGGDALRDSLLQKSELRARNELLRDLKQHAQRSQYDCEAAARAGRYLKAGLDVWGFASWQVKYFPADSYRGATLDQCRTIKTVVASSVDLQSAVARQNPDESEQR